MTGRLLLVATPIGNLDDLTPRAKAAFAEADLIACEDTRRTGLLLHNLGIKKPLLSLHEHNERARTSSVLAALDAGQTVAVASDAGTPLLSDPGYVVTRAAIAGGHRVEAIPGASAPLVALLVSGLPPHPFTFAGFPPPKSGKRRAFFRRFAEPRPHADRLRVTAPNRGEPRRRRSPSSATATAALASELTKMNEEVVRGKLSEIRTSFAQRDRILGEFVLVIGSAIAEVEQGGGHSDDFEPPADD